MNNELKRRFNRTKIEESLRELNKNSRKTSTKIYTAAAEAIEFIKIRYEADRILREIYA